MAPLPRVFPEPRRWCALLAVFLLLAPVSGLRATAPETVLAAPQRLVFVQPERLLELAAEPADANWKVALRQAADALRTVGPEDWPSVVANDFLPASGDPRDYFSMGPYWWPNPDTEDGLPYVRRDGQFNPKRDRISDRDAAHRLVDEVATLAYAAYFFADEAYAVAAAGRLEHFFLDEETGMRPHMRFAQAIPGRVDGRGIGIVDTLKFTELVDPLALLARRPVWEEARLDRLRPWFGDFLDWLLVHPQGRREQSRDNNHGTAYDLQVAALAAWLGRDQLVDVLLTVSVPSRLEAQIEADGRQPLELKRTRAWSYVNENLHHFFRLGILGRGYGVDLFRPDTVTGDRLQAAWAYFAGYVNRPQAWPHQQVTAWQLTYYHDLWRWVEAVWPAVEAPRPETEAAPLTAMHARLQTPMEASSAVDNQ